MKNKLYEWTRSIQTYKHKKGFTLIELIVVMAIIGILVLIAAPRFLGRTEDAIATRIQNDINTAETKIDEYLIEKGGLDEWGDKTTLAEMNGLKNEGKLHNRSGVMGDGNIISTGTYSKVPDALVDGKIKSHLDGDFYTNKEGDVYYYGMGGANPEGEVVTEDVAIPDYYVEATDSDFEYVIDSNAPGGGFYFYVGAADYVIIPDVINGEPITSAYRMFGIDNNLTVSTVKGAAVKNSNISNMSMMFYKNVSDSLELDYLDTSSATHMDYMFTATRAESLDLSNFDTSNVVTMYRMFYEASASIINISNFKTSNVNNMMYMFSRTKATTLDLSNLDTSSVTNMYAMFSQATALVLDASGFNTSMVTNMRYMFQFTEATTLNVSNFDTRNVTDMSDMFKETQFTTIDLSSFDTTSVTTMSRMFNNSAATSINLNSFDTTSVGSMQYMFNNAKANVLDLSSFDMTNTGTKAMLGGASATESYARTQEDADILNSSSYNSNNIEFVVK